MSLEATLVAFRPSSGEKRGAFGSSDKFRLQFLSLSPTWEFLKHHDVSILADGFLVRPESGHKGDVDREDGEVSESVSWAITFDQIKRLVKAREVEIAVGDRDVRLNPQQVAALKNLADRLSVSSEEAEKIAAEHSLLVRERRREIREAMDAAVEKARATVRVLPRSRRATEAHEVGMEKLREEFGPTDMKYRPTADEMRELFDA